MKIDKAMIYVGIAGIVILIWQWHLKMVKEGRNIFGQATTPTNTGVVPPPLATPPYA
jgi:predicted permease